MPSRTISLEDSAYARLKAAKRPGESFSDVVNRLLTKGGPSLLDLWGALGPEAGADVADAMEQMRREAEQDEATRWRAWGWRPREDQS